MSKRLFVLLLFALAGLSSTLSVAYAQSTPRPLPAFRDFDEAQYEQNFRHHFTEVNDLTLHYVMGGEGPPLVARFVARLAFYGLFLSSNHARARQTLHSNSSGLARFWR